MARPLRIEFPGAWYHALNRGKGRQPVFKNRILRNMFLKLMAEVSEIFRLEFHAYCLMENHYHLLIRTPEGGLGRAMRHLNGVFTQRHNRLHKTDGPLFRGRYKAILIEADSYLKQVSRYIHLNPIRAGLVASPEAYEWSSYKAFLDRRCCPDWLHTSFTLSQFDHHDGREEYREFVEAGTDSELLEYYENLRGRPILGTDQFRNEICKKWAPKRRDREIPDSGYIRPRTTMESVLAAVSTVFAIPMDKLVRQARSRDGGCGLARGAVIHLARTAGGHDLTTIATCMSYNSYAGASTALRRFNLAMKSDPSIVHKLREARRLLNQDET